MYRRVMHYKLITVDGETTREPCECPIDQDHEISDKVEDTLTDTVADRPDIITGIAPE